MLISHLYKFIYLKTVKTGGTSVEIYFEPYCVAPGTPAGDRHFREAESSQFGVIAPRGDPIPNDPILHPHMSASRIREITGEALWNEYYKFSVVRNPFDKVVSQFWIVLFPPVRELLKHADFSAVRKVFTVGRPPLLYAKNSRGTCNILAIPIFRVWRPIDRPTAANRNAPLHEGRRRRRATWCRPALGNR
jgi:hypothetical protein